MSLTTAPFEVPNLDDLTTDPAELNALGNDLIALGNYARRKAEAMRHRQNGNISLALVLEQRCEAIYSLLPEWARW